MKGPEGKKSDLWLRLRSEALERIAVETRQHASIFYESLRESPTHCACEMN